MMENGDFAQGMPLPVDPSDAHAEHIDEHLKPLEAILQQYQQNGGQIDKEKVPAMVITMEHTGQHFSFLVSDETQKAAYQQLWPRFSQVKSMVTGILTRLQKEQQAQQQNGQMGGPPNILPYANPAIQGR
jgi:hypothetical protein